MSAFWHGRNVLVTGGNGFIGSHLVEMLVAEKSPQVATIDLGTPEETSIRDLAHIIVRLSGREVEVVFDPSKPGGQPRRNCDTRLAERLLGFHAEISLKEGLRRTIAWYAQQHVEAAR